MKKIILATILLSSLATFAVDTAAPGTKEPMNPAKKEELKGDRQAIDLACTAESSTAGCGSEKVGTGLLKCIHAYKKDHKKDFKISEGCKTAMHKLRSDRTSK